MFISDFNKFRIENISRLTTGYEPEKCNRECAEDISCVTLNSIECAIAKVLIDNDWADRSHCTVDLGYLTSHINKAYSHNYDCLVLQILSDFDNVHIYTYYGDEITDFIIHIDFNKIEPDSPESKFVRDIMLKYSVMQCQTVDNKSDDEPKTSSLISKYRVKGYREFTTFSDLMKFICKKNSSLGHVHYFQTKGMFEDTLIIIAISYSLFKSIDEIKDMASSVNKRRLDNILRTNTSKKSPISYVWKCKDVKELNLSDIDNLYRSNDDGIKTYSLVYEFDEIEETKKDESSDNYSNLIKPDVIKYLTKLFNTNTEINKKIDENDELTLSDFINLVDTDFDVKKILNESVVKLNDEITKSIYEKLTSNTSKDADDCCDSECECDCCEDDVDTNYLELFTGDDCEGCCENCNKCCEAAMNDDCDDEFCDCCLCEHDCEECECPGSFCDESQFSEIDEFVKKSEETKKTDEEITNALDFLKKEFLKDRDFVTVVFNRNTDDGSLSYHILIE